MDFSFSPFPSTMRVVLDFTQFHLIDIFIVMLRSFVLCVVDFLFFSPQRFIRLENRSNIFISILFSYILMFIVKVWIFFFILTSTHPGFRFGFILVHVKFFFCFFFLFVCLLLLSCEIYYSWICMETEKENLGSWYAYTLNIGKET